MKINYAELIRLLECFKVEDDIVYFDNPKTGQREQVFIHYQQNTYIQEILCYLKHVYFFDDCNGTALEIEFSPDMINDDAEFKLDSVVHEMRALLGNDTFIIPNKSYKKDNYDTKYTKYINILNEIYGKYTNIKHPVYSIIINGEKLHELMSSVNIIEELYSSIGLNANANVNDLRYIYLVGNDINITEAYELREVVNKFVTELKSISVNTSIKFMYYTKDFVEYSDSKYKERIDTAELESANKYFAKQLTIAELKGHEEFYKSAKGCKDAFDAVCEFVSKGSYNRYYVGSDVTKIPHISYILAWVTLVKGIVFIIKGSDESYMNIINKMLDVTSSFLPASTRYKLLCKQPLIRDKFLLAGFDTKYGETDKYHGLCAIKSINRPVQAYRGVPLKTIFSEIKCTLTDLPNKFQMKPCYAGFYIDEARFNNADTIQLGPDMHAVSSPYDTIDIVLEEFNKRIDSIVTNPKISGQSRELFENDKHRSDLLDTFLYAFEIIFMHYMGYDKFYTLNDIFIMRVDNNGESELYACTLQFNVAYEVNAINFRKGKPIIDTNTMLINKVYSPEYLENYAYRVCDDNGFEYPEINPMLTQAIDEAIKVTQPRAIDESLLLQTTAEASNDEVEINYQSYMYPVISASLCDFIEGTVSIDTDLTTAIGLYITELILTVNGENVNYEAFDMEDFNSDKKYPVYIGNKLINMTLKQKIIHELSDHTATIDRDLRISNLFFDKGFSYKGLRYLHPLTEAPISWAGKLKLVKEIPPALCRKH